MRVVEAVLVISFNSALHLVEMYLERTNLVFSDRVEHRETQHAVFHQHAELVELAVVSREQIAPQQLGEERVETEFTDKGALADARFQHSERVELLQRHFQRGAAYAEILCQLNLRGNLLADLPFSAGDFFQNDVKYLIGYGAAVNFFDVCFHWLLCSSLFPKVMLLLTIANKNLKCNIKF